uniref:2-oxoglutarate-dependent dioxygenase htyE-like isoform X2 n=1 Tax=Styela clava TaxID=7725 RepID=UPI00193A20E6|nr:2-oxoglutarate-dependent dioxygenase htyE-like isoform X2 [Styela clava]
MELGVIDFAKCNVNFSQPTYEDLKKVGEEIYEAFSTIGFVYLKDTGISDNDPTKPGEYKESFDVSGPGLASLDSKWPDEDLPGFSDTLKKFTKKLGQLAMRIIEALSIGMKIKDVAYLQKRHSRINNVKNITTLRSLYYPVIPKDYVIKDGEMRLGEHTDFGSFTILFQDFVGGLQVMRQDGTFIEATPIPGTALVNIGDCLQFWTKGKLKSTIHRIPMPEVDGPMNKKRSSLVYFVMPDHEAELSEIECEGVVLSPDTNDTPTIALEHLQKKYAEVNMPIPN